MSESNRTREADVEAEEEAEEAEEEALLLDRGAEEARDRLDMGTEKKELGIMLKSKFASKVMSQCNLHITLS